jgi:hypothetical protein
MDIKPGLPTLRGLVAPIARRGQLLIKVAFFCQLEASRLIGHKGKPSPPPSSRRRGG